LTELLILLPFLMKRFAMTPIGWMHPLILPSMVGIATGLIRNPASLLQPISIWVQPIQPWDHILLGGWSVAAVHSAQLKVSLLNFLAIIATYIGFASVRAGSTDCRQSTHLRINGYKIAITFIFGLLAVTLFIQQQGGIVSHVTSLAFGRYGMRELNGHFLVLCRFLPYILLLWYAYKPKATKNIYFLIAYLIAALLQFIVTGSRSSMLLTFAVFLGIYMIHKRRIAIIRLLIFALITSLILGALGQVRRSGRNGVADFSALTELNIAAALDATHQELSKRKAGTDLAIAALVPDQRGFLLGTTYVSALAFWIPRSIWLDKPRGAGAYAAALLYGGRETMEDYSGGGIPVNGVSEAYWNFGYLGVLVIYLLYGAILSAVARWVYQDLYNPFATITLLIINFVLTSPSSPSIVTTIQLLSMLWVLRLFVSRFRFY
jgi:hypothetical protein